jgi:anti-sigma factor RsiW
MNNESGINKEELHAFIDGELDPIRAAEFTKLVASDPALAARVAAFRSDKKRLDQIYGSLHELPVPPEWLQLIRDTPVRRPQTFSRVAFSRQGIVAIAASLLLILTVNLGFVYEGVIGTNEDAVITEALAARQDSTRPEQSLAVASVAPEERNQVLTTALSMTLKAPDLTRLGYRLENIRVYSSVPGGKAAELAYRDAQNRLFTLYLRHPSSPPRVDLVERDGMRICIWQDEVLSTVMLGEMSAGEMARIASLAYSGLAI